MAKMMIFRLILVWLMMMVATTSTAKLCTPSLTPAQAFLMVTNRDTSQSVSSVVAKPAKLININTATEAELTQLDGIGAKKAQQIILYRQMIAPFASADELSNVKGIGQATVDKNRHRITTQ